MKMIQMSVAKLSVFLVLCTNSLFLPTSTAISQEAVTRDEVRTIIREYLLENPEILLEVQQALEQKQQEELALTQQQTIQENQELLYNSPYQIVFGDINAKKTIVEFFDYNCSFCQRAMADMQEFIEKDKDVKFVLKEFPVLGEASLDASRVSMAFSKIMPEKHPQFHVDLLSFDGIKDRETALQVAESLGAERSAIEAEMEDPEILQALRDVYEVANGLGISGTPSYVTGDQVVFGAVGYDQLKEAIDSQTN